MIVADILPDPNGFQRPQRLSDHVYEELKALILSNQLQPGEALTEERFAAQWHISRTPLRAALVRLERDGLVRILPHRGCVITDITPRMSRASTRCVKRWRCWPPNSRRR